METELPLDLDFGQSDRWWGVCEQELDGLGNYAGASSAAESTAHRARQRGRRTNATQIGKGWLGFVIARRRGDESLHPGLSRRANTVRMRDGGLQASCPGDLARLRAGA